jgi:oligogalacturonate-specific porin family protein
MKKLLALAMLPLACASQATTLDTRLSYDTVNKDYIDRIYVGNTWSNGLAGSLEANFLLTGIKNSDKIDAMHTGNTEVVGWWTYRFSPELFIRPGLSTLVNAGTTSTATLAAGTTGGSTSRPFVTLGYKAADDLDMSLRYRFQHRNYNTMDLSKQLDRDNAHNLTLWFGYKLSDSVNLEYQLDYIKKINNYTNDNGKKSIFENEVVVLFPDAFGKGVTPHFTLDHLGRSVKTIDGTPATHWRPRLGIKFSF